MIYEYPDNNAPIRQGDIFFGIPRMDISLKNIPVVITDKVEEKTWKDIAEKKERVAAIISIEPVTAIVVSQDCDALRVPDITLCEIRKFSDV